MTAVLENLPAGVRARRWTRDEYYRALALGLFRPDERLELLNGVIVEKVSENPEHSSAVRLTREQLTAFVIGTGAFASEQHPITLPVDTEPEPDIVVVRGRLRDFDHRHPAPADVLLAVEVSRSTLEFDRSVKADIYAAAGIPEYWIVNLRDRQLEVHRAPQNGVWTLRQIVPETGSIAPLATPTAAIAVTDLLPAP